MTDAPRYKRCDACGAELLFTKNRATGKWLPLQKVRTIYAMHDGQADKVTAFDSAGHNQESNIETYVSHFETCTDPSRFSRRKK